MIQLPARQIHLDFHTSEYIPDVGKEFQPETFARTFREAHVNSVTVFARCVHGWMYYPSEKFPERVHPTLAHRNLLLEQVRALHSEGIKAPVYIAVQWDRYSAERYPQWLIRKADGSHEGASFSQPGFDQSLCVNTDYFAFLAEHTLEVCDLLGDELDGLFFDMVGIRPCLCSACRSKMRSQGIDLTDERAVRAFAKASMDAFKEKMTKLVRQKNKTCTIFYNAGHIGPCTEVSAQAYTHYELESLPSGQWGYLHFPITARYARTIGKDCLGMTGKFHTEWGDFHSLKNQAALEFECFRMLSYGFACSVGDQLEPSGRLNPAAYRLIGKVYRQVEACEPWARPSRAVVEAALVTPENPLYELKIPDSVMGAAQMLEELAVQFDIINPGGRLEDYAVLFLPEDLEADAEFQQRLDHYVAGGGRVLACGRGGLSKEGTYPSCFGVDYQGKMEVYPDFLVPVGEMAEGLEENNEYVIYLQEEKLQPKEGTETLVGARAPYFKREKERFCSHVYTPSAKGECYPSVCRNGNVVVFSHPMFQQYRQNAPGWCRQLIRNALKMLGVQPLIEHGGPSYLSVSVLHQPEQKRYSVHLLSYVPIRKSATIDLIEEATVLYNVPVKLRLDCRITGVRTARAGEQLECRDGRTVVPRIDGYEILEISYEPVLEA
ncbi:MAG: alpha-amylase family protein [Candidatus Limivivens sp.]|nr:alpha-amylase family protein [Candidatus Limivivens sp.]